MRWMLFVMVTAGCGKPAKDCEAFGAQVAELSDPASESQRQMSTDVSVTACKKGRVSDAELACVAKATTRDELLDCQIPGRHRPVAQPAPVAAPPVAPLPDAPPPPGTNRVTLISATSAGVARVDVDHDPAQHTWFASLQRGVAACSPATPFPEAREVEVFVSFGSPFNRFEPADLSAELLRCVQDALAGPAPASIDAGVTFRVAVGR